MAESRSHQITAKRIARKLGADYNDGIGVDIKSARATVQVETLETVHKGIKQLQGHRGPAYTSRPCAKPWK